MLFLQAPEPKAVKNSMHECLQPEGARDDEVARVLGIGATMFGASLGRVPSRRQDARTCLRSRRYA